MFRRSPNVKKSKKKNLRSRSSRIRHEMLEDRVLLVADLGTNGMLGNDLTDLGDDGIEGSYAPPNLAGFDAEFFGDDEPNFNPPNNEGAFNVFDNLAGGGQNKWCCNDASSGDGIHVGANFSNTLLAGMSSTDGIILTHFTITSDNDSGTARDPDNWRIQGSNDGTTWTDIFSYNIDGNSPFDDFGGSVEQRTLRYDAGVDFPRPEPFKQFRYLALDTVNNNNHALSEIEFFSSVEAVNDDYTGLPVDENTTLTVNEGLLDLLHNDSGVPLTVIGFDATSANGAAVNVNSDGSFTYNPDGSATLQALDNGQIFTDTFTYTVNDGSTIIVPGLLYGRLSGNVNDTDPNPATGISIDLSEANDNDLPGNTTEVYTGQFFDADGVVSFRESNDDKTRLWIDGNLVLNNDQWDVHTDTGTLNLTPGWHDFELRMSNGNGGAGAVGGAGFQYDPDGGTNWEKIQDTPGLGAMILRHIAPNPAATDTAVASVQIIGLNDAPVATDDASAIDEAVDGAPNPNTVTGNVLNNDSDVDDPNSSFTVTNPGTHALTYGTLQLNSDGSYTYTLDDANTTVNGLQFSESLTDTFNYTMTDNHSGGNAMSDNATLTITINGVNDSPIATDNTATVTEADPGDMTVDAGNVITDDDGSGADSDPDNAQNTLSIVDVDGETNPANNVVGTYGTLDWNADGSYTYSLDNGNGAVQAIDDGEMLTDSFTYTVADPFLTGDGLFNIRLLRTNNPNPGNFVDNWLNLFNTMDAEAPGTTGTFAGYDVQYNVDDTETEFNYGQRGNFDPTPAINSINNNGPGGSGGPFNGGNDYAIRGRTYLAFNAAGTFSIAMGSDDGRRIELTEAAPGSAPGYGGFTQRGDQTSGSFTAGDTVIYRDGGTGHAQSVGVFTVNAGDVLLLDAFYYNGSGGHSGEIMIKAGVDTDVPGGNNSDPQAFNDGWRLLSDGLFGISLDSTNSFTRDATDTATLTVTINGTNDAPTIDSNGNVAVIEGDMAVNTGTFGDVDIEPIMLSASVGTVMQTSGSTWSWSWNTNDGPAQSQMVTITADDGTTTTSTTFMLTVDNAPPTLLLDAVADIDENDAVTLTGDYNDPGTGDSHTIVVDWNDPNTAAGSTFAVPAINSLSVGAMVSSTTDGAVLTVTSVNAMTGDVGFSIASHTYLDDGPAPGNGTASDPVSINVGIVDSDGAGAGSVANMTVSNVAPVAEDDDFTTDENTAVVGNLFADNGNGADSDTSPLDVLTVVALNGQVALLTGLSAYGAAVTIDPLTGNFTYDPANAAALQVLSSETVTDTFTYTITDDDTGTNTATVSIEVSGDGTVEVDTTSFVHVFEPIGALPPTVTTLGGSETILLTVDGTTMDVDIGGMRLRTGADIASATPVSVVGVAGNTLSVDDSADLDADGAASVDFDSIDGLLDSGSVISHTGVATLTIDAGTGGDTFTLNGLAGGAMTSVTVNGNAGDDTFISTPQTVTVNVNGNSPVLPADPGDTLNLDLTAEPVPLVLPTTVDGSFASADVANAPINWTSIETFIINGEVVPVNRLFVDATENSDRIIFFPTNNDEFRLRINNDYYGPFDALAIEAIETLGREGSDRIMVSGRLDIPVQFDGGEGNDYLAGGINDDHLIGGPGNDILLGGEGNNTLDGGADNDRAEGRGGVDYIFGGSGNDRLNGGAGNDIVDGGTGTDYIFGGLGDDLLVGRSGVDLLRGHEGNDVIFGGSDSDQLFGDNGDDILFGGLGADRVRGDIGNDDVIGGDSSIESDLETALDAMMATFGTSLADANMTIADGVAAWQSSGTDRSGLGTLNDDDTIDELYGGNGIDPNWTDEFHSENDNIRDLRVSEGDSIITP